MKRIFQPIDIQIENKRKYGLIALLVDRDDFLTEIEEIRNRIGVLSIPYVFPTLYPPEANATVEFYQKGLLTINDVRIELQKLCFEKKLPGIFQIDKILGLAVIYAEILLKTYRKSKLYFPVMLASILVGKITTYDFLSTYMLELNFKETLQELDVIEAENRPFAIIVNRESTVKEVQHVFDFIRKYYLGTKKVASDDGLMTKVYKDKIPQTKITDTMPSIEVVRRWYWLNKNERLGAKRIWDRLVSSNEDFITPKGIEEALRRYKKNLQKPL